jgi:predicted RNA methylase
VWRCVLICALTPKHILFSAVFDLGCGDGRICILASKLTHCHSIGAEIEPDLVAKFRHNIVTHMEHVQGQELVQVYEGDLRDLDIQVCVHVQVQVWIHLWVLL